MEGALRLLVISALLAPALAGCATPWSREEGSFGNGPVPIGGGGTPTVPPPSGPPLVWSGTVVGALTGEAVAGSTVRLDLAQTRPCERQGIGWTSWQIPVAENGTFGPLETARPNSNEVAFFLHVRAPNHTDEALYFGPAEARQGTSGLRIELEPEARVDGAAPPGTLVALTRGDFPRILAADDHGRFSYPGAGVRNATVLAATEPPQSLDIEPPAAVEFEAPRNASAWRLEGSLRLESGAPVAGDVAAWRGEALVSVARAGENGIFVLPLAAEAQELRIEARTESGQYGSTLARTVSGPPAARETLLMRPLC